MTTNHYQQNSLSTLTHQLRFSRGMIFGVIIITALLSFELFNYSTTDFALSDLLGDLSFIGVRWATILSIAFCSIDFAGIARLFTPEGGSDPHKEVWYLFGAWLLAATMNAMLTWWGVSIAILNHETLGNAVVERTTLLRIVPIFVAVLVWVIRVLIIGTFSVAGDRLFTSSQDNVRSYRGAPNRRPDNSRSIGKPRTSNRNNKRRLPAARSAKPAHSFADRSGYGGKAPSRFFNSNPKPSERPYQSHHTPDPPAPPEPEYVGMEQAYHPTITASHPNQSNKSRTFNDNSGRTKGPYHS